jgi:hypothetical protein
VIGNVWQTAVLAAARLMAGTVRKKTPLEDVKAELVERATRIKEALEKKQS